MDSWGKILENYIVNNVHGDTTIYGACEAGALIGADGTVWAATQGFALNPSSKIKVAKEDGTSEETTINELDHIKDAITNQGDTQKMKKGGVHFLGTKWVVLDGYQGEDYRTQYFRKEGGGAAITMTSKGNLVLGTWTQTTKAISVKDGVQKEVKQSVGFCNNAVDDLSKVVVGSGL
mmetsp:Transcript_33187/g.34489  ORF Transcript_33187/g.34489 Transcript_33187/m.34489 type:complete len:177 (-) Transcript_33187:80-610(-)